MANPEHLSTLKKGVPAWNAWRRARPKIDPDLSGANLMNAKLKGANLRAADMEKTLFIRTDFETADIRDANLAGANMCEANLVGANLHCANLRKADLSKAELRQADLRDANLTGANLCDADMRWVELKGALLRGVDLRGANLSDTNLWGIDLNGADLTGANLSDAHLGNAVLSNTNLRQVDFSRAYLHNLNLTEASIGYAVFGDCDLSTVIGLESVQHVGPSVVGVDTIFRSHGNIPESFLRRVGIPEDFIAYMKPLVARPVQFFSCFISYSTKDQEFADRLYFNLHRKGVSCWFATHDLQAGRKVHEQIDDAIRLYDKLLLILSPHSMNSEWVKTEIAKARKREKEENRRMLFPISLVSFNALEDWECFDADIGKDSAREIREFYIPDFSEWGKKQILQ